MSDERIAVIATASPSGEVGGAERFYLGLRDALCLSGANAEIVYVPSDESNFENVMESYLRFYDLDLSEYAGVISTKAPGYLVQHENHVCYLQHTMRVFYDMFDSEFPEPDRGLREQRRRIIELDTAALASPGIKRRFVIGQEVRDRLRAYNGLDSDVLYQNTTLSGFRCGEQKYLFLPSRLHRWKRVNLVIEAMKFVTDDVTLLISGTGEDEVALRALASEDRRIRFLGRVSDDALLELYADAIAVPFVAAREDFGLVAVEAFHSEKPVITCEDSGEPARMIERYGCGLICEPRPEAIAACINSLVGDLEGARALGSASRRFKSDVSWEHVAASLRSALDT
ncbi:MAG: glycosyltransferase family 4 protein [Steroidobacteraceae bacterium]